MAMQLCCVNTPSPVLPPSDIELMRNELNKIDNLMKEVDAGTATEETFKNLKQSLSVANEIILSLDNSNDFFKIGGFKHLLPLLNCPDFDVVAATAELIADLVQNNTFCQSKMLDFNPIPELIKLIGHQDSKVCLKALYALSCLCRHNEDALKQLEVSSFLPLLLELLQRSDEKLKTKSAFFLSYLCSCESFRESLYQADIIGVLLKLINSDYDSSSEHLLSALEAQVSHHKQSRIQCRRDEYNLKELLQSKIAVFDSRSECNEAKHHCSRILDVCFHEQKTA